MKENAKIRRPTSLLSQLKQNMELKKKCLQRENVASPAKRKSGLEIQD